MIEKICIPNDSRFGVHCCLDESPNNFCLNPVLCASFFWKILLLKICCFRTVPLVIQPVKHLQSSTRFYLFVHPLFRWRILAIRILRFNTCGLFSVKISSVSPRPPKQWRWELNSLSTKYRDIYARLLLKILPKEYWCSTIAVTVVHWMCCSIHSPRISTLWISIYFNTLLQKALIKIHVSLSYPSPIYHSQTIPVELYSIATWKKDSHFV